MKPMAIGAGADRHVDVVRVKSGGPAACGRVGRVGPQVAQMGEPGAVLAFEPVEVTVRQKGRHADLLGPIGLGRERPEDTFRYVVAETPEPFGPALVFAGEIEPDREARQHAFVAGKAWIIT